MRPRPTGATRIVRSCAAVTAALLLAASDVGAQRASGPAAPAGDTAAGAGLEIAVLTMGQGDQVWERFGHNALWVRDRARGTETAYNWGVFDFAAPDFLLRFLTGDTRYWVEAVDAHAMLDLYQRYGRSITVQRLALSPAQRVAVRDFVEWNAREENKYYRYDYFRDNCSTRLRDVVDRALGGALRRALDTARTGATYRSESVRLTDGMAFTQGGIYTALGHPADRPLTQWELGFIPMRLRDAMRAVRVPDASGRPVPLVVDERVIYQAPRAPETPAAPALWLRYLAVGIALALVLLAAGEAARRGGAGRAVLAAAGALWGLVPGVLGTVLLAAWLVTRHVFWYRNENLLPLSPLSLGLAVLVPLAVYRPRFRVAALRLAGVVLLLAVIGAAVKLLPTFRQRNAAVLALMLPAHLGAYLTLHRLWRARE